MDTPDISTAVLTEQTHLLLPTRPEWIEPAVEYARTKAIMAGACQEARAGKLVVALHEALTNAMVHGNLELSSELKERADGAFAEALAQRLADPRLSARFVEMVIDYDGKRCRWILTDEGSGFDVERALARATSDDPEVMLASGRGMIIMRSFMDDVRYELGGKRVVLTMSQASGHENRRQERQAFCRPLEVVPVLQDGDVDWPAAYEAMSQNISAGGLSLLQDRLSVSQRIIVGVPAGNSMVYVPAEIRHVQPLAGNAVEIGCRFETGDRPAPEGMEDVHRVVEVILESIQRGSVDRDERRSHARLPFHARVELRAGGKPTIVGFARNLSKGGLAFWAAVPIALETCTLAIAHGKEPVLGLSARVCRCTKVMEGLYDVSAEFLGLKAPPRKA
jgi:anti-sigma regulatory factor (Ser/Thr protein kinase)